MDRLEATTILLQKGAFSTARRMPPPTVSRKATELEARLGTRPPRLHGHQAGLNRPTRGR
jgi:hypothetical protein